jgi:DNA-binding phage protein
MAKLAKAAGVRRESLHRALTAFAIGTYHELVIALPWFTLVPPRAFGL